MAQAKGLKAARSKWYRDRKRAVMIGYEDGMDSDQLVFICQLFRNWWKEYGCA